MTLQQFEKRLQAVNPRLRIKQYGTSMAGVYLDNEYVLRLPVGEQNPYNTTLSVVDKASQYVTKLNPEGLYVWQKMVARGRNEVALMLHIKHLIKFDDMAKLSL